MDVIGTLLGVIGVYLAYIHSRPRLEDRVPHRGVVGAASVVAKEAHRYDGDSRSQPGGYVFRVLEQR